MIRRSSEIKEIVLTDFKGGNGPVSMFPFMTEEEAKGTGRLFVKSILEPGNSIGTHSHEGDFEVYYILKGKALINDNGNEVVLEAGDCNICDDGEFHSIKNVGDDNLEYLAIILYTKQK